RLFSSLLPPPPTSTLFPYTTLFRSTRTRLSASVAVRSQVSRRRMGFPRNVDSQRTKEADTHFHLGRRQCPACPLFNPRTCAVCRSEEHTSELQSQSNLVCRLLLEKK